MKALLDTNILAELVKPNGNPAVHAALAEDPDPKRFPERAHRGGDREGHRPPRPRQEEDLTGGSPGLRAISGSESFRSTSRPPESGAN